MAQKQPISKKKENQISVKLTETWKVCREWDSLISVRLPHLLKILNSKNMNSYFIAYLNISSKSNEIFPTLSLNMVRFKFELLKLIFTFWGCFDNNRFKILDQGNFEIFFSSTHRDFCRADLTLAFFLIRQPSHIRKVIICLFIFTFLLIWILMFKNFVQTVNCIPEM